MKNEELSCLQVQLDKMHCSLLCETEKNASLQLDVSRKGGDLEDCQRQYVALSTELLQLKQQNREMVLT